MLFFAANSRFGIFVATGAFMVAVLIALAVSYALTRHIAIMPVVTAVIVLVFGGLTLVLHDDLFIKLKPTIIYVLFGGTLLGGLALGKPLLGILFDQMFHLTDEGWRKLTWRWVLFFFALAVLNEIVWRNADHRFLGQLQGVRRGAADVRVRRAADPLIRSTRSPVQRRSSAMLTAARLLDLRLERRRRFSARDRPDQLVGDAGRRGRPR